MENYTVKFNKKAYEGKSKAEFIEAEKHHSEFGVDLDAEYDKMFPAQETKKADAKAPADKGKTE